MLASLRIIPEVIERIKKEIDSSHGNEVMCAGHVNESGHVDEIIIAARGNEMSVPALLEYMEKGDVVIHNHPSGNLTPSSADLKVASHIGNQGIGFFIVDNNVEELYAVAEPILRKKKKKINFLKLAPYIEHNGKLNEIMPSFEKRESQIEMMEMIIDSFNDDKICEAEAGTGVGKSIAYLLPAFKWAEHNDERIVISTATINLQQQLIEKDIPLVKQILGSKVKAVLVKGRSNYICLRRLSEQMEENSLFREDDSELSKIYEWAISSKTGSINDLAFYPDSSLWSKICSESDACMGLKCRNREKCFILKLKREAASAKILVVNHHLLFSDIAMRHAGAGYDSTAVLPPFQKIIFDEAHNIEKSATSYFSGTLNKYNILKQLNRIYRKKKGRAFGLIFSVKKYSNESFNSSEFSNYISNIQKKIDELEASAMQLLDNKYSFSFNDEITDSNKKTTLGKIKELHFSIIDLIEALYQVLDKIREDCFEETEVFELKVVLRRLEEVASFCEKFSKIDNTEDEVYWIEKNRNSDGEFFPKFYITPISIAGLMCESVFEPYNTVVCVSATLTINKKFDFWEKRTGLKFYPEEGILKGIFKSPFNYKKNALLALPTDMPFPNEETYMDKMSSYIRESLIISEGRALVLFTSYESLNYVHGQIKEDLNKLGITLLKQGDDNKSRLLNNFRTDTASVLLATDSFWEGVDNPGDSLKIVVIAKLPFRVPSDPVVKARARAIEIKGGNPFMELSLPEAIMKLKQGFGRLIRNNTDRGIVLILDSRILRKFYGKLFIESLPDAGKITESKNSIMESIEDFLY